MSRATTSGIGVERLAVAPRNTLPYRLSKRPFIFGVASLLKRLQRIRTEDVQVFGSGEITPG